MGNGFTGPPAVDFYSQLSGLGDTLQANAVLRQKQQVNQARQAAFSDFSSLDPSSPDYGKQAMTVAQKLGSAGDQEGALKFLSLAQTAADRTHTYAREGETDRHTRVMEGYAGRAADRADEDKPVIKEVTDPNTGATSFVRINPKGAEGPVNTGSPAPTTPNNPYAYPGKTTEAQSKDIGYANRMFRAEQVLRDPKVVEAATSWPQAGIEGTPLIPGAVKNWAHSPDYQKFDQAKRDFVNAVLRRESGAAISQSEFDNAYKQYFPQPGDTPERMAEKQKNRQDTLAGIAGGGGQGYKPPYTFGPNGELVATGNPKQGATPVTPKAAASAVPPQAIAALKKDPRLLAQFEAKYGKGSAKAVLGASTPVEEE